jgi:RIO kinase 1
MKIPPRLLPLVEDGIIDEVIGQVRSGKEADVFTVRVGSEIRCAKVYKEAIHRSFRQSVNYQEGRAVKNSRTARAQSRGSRFGQKEAETSWITAEVNALNALSAAGLRVPKPFGFFDGVLIMELIVGADGEPAPRLNDLELTPDTALDYHEFLIDQILQMLCMGLIHGDLSEFNVLVDAHGPVIIDLPQVVNAAGNMNAAMMFARDVNNMAAYFGRFEPGILTLKYAKEMWALFEKGKLNPHVELTGQYIEPKKAVDVRGVLSVIDDVRQEREDKIARRNGERRPSYGADRGPGRDPVHGTDPGSRPDHGSDRNRGPRPEQGGDRSRGREDRGSRPDHPRLGSNPSGQQPNRQYPNRTHSDARPSGSQHPHAPRPQGSRPPDSNPGPHSGPRNDFRGGNAPQQGAKREERNGGSPQRGRQRDSSPRQDGPRHQSSHPDAASTHHAKPGASNPHLAQPHAPKPAPGAQPFKPKPAASEQTGQDDSWGRRPQRGGRRTPE